MNPQIPPFLLTAQGLEATQKRGQERKVGVAEGRAGRVGLLLLPGAGPLRPGPGWRGTKARECGLGRHLVPPSVSHLYFTGLRITGSPAPLAPAPSGADWQERPEVRLLQPAEPLCQSLLEWAGGLPSPRINMPCPSS